MSSLGLPPAFLPDVCGGVQQLDHHTAGTSVPSLATVGLGAVAVLARMNGWPIAVPPAVLAAGIGATLLIGAVAGLYPAIRAARTPPTASLNG